MMRKRPFDHCRASYIAHVARQFGYPACVSKNINNSFQVEVVADEGHIVLQEEPDYARFRCSHILKPTHAHNQALWDAIESTNPPEQF